MKLTHTRLLVDDFEACLSFYRDVVGFPVGLDVGSGIYAEFETGDATLAIYSRELMVGVVGGIQGVHRSRDEVVVTFAVDGVDETYERLLDRGVDFVTEPHDQPTWMLRVAHFRDPDGHLLEIYEPLEVTA